MVAADRAPTPLSPEQSRPGRAPADRSCRTPSRPSQCGFRGARCRRTGIRGGQAPARAAEPRYARARPAWLRCRHPARRRPVTATATSARECSSAPATIASATSRLTAPCCRDQRHGHADQFVLGFVGVRDESALDHIRRARDFGQHAGYQTAGTAFSRRDHQLARAERREERLGGGDQGWREHRSHPLAAGALRAMTPQLGIYSGRLHHVYLDHRQRRQPFEPEAP